MHFTSYALPSIASALVTFSLFIYVLIFRRHSSGAWQFIIIMVCFAAWAFGYAMVPMHVDIIQKVFWFNLAQIGPDFAPVFWLLLAFEHSGRRDLLWKRWNLGLFVIPLISTVMMWTNDWHHWLRSSVALKTIEKNTTYLSIERGPWYIIETLYGYIIIVITLYILIRFITLSSSKKQTLALICSVILPILSNIQDVFQINPLKPYGPTSIIFSFTGMVLAWGLFRQHFLDITPIARNVVLENIGDGVIVLDKDNRIVDANPAVYRLFNEDFKTSSQLIGKDIHDVISLWPDWDEPFIISSDTRTQLVLKVDGERHFYHVTISSLADKRHESVGWVTIFNDITDEKQTNERLQNQLDEIKHLQGQLHEQAIRDSLTGCFNRHYLNEMLVCESSRADRDKNTNGMIMLDIDHFKQINDTHGHVNGDCVPRVIGENLQHWVRVEDMVCRYGGEEFLIVFPGISIQAITERASNLCSQIAALQVPASSDSIIKVTVSMGVALYPVHEENIDMVLEYADQTLYAAKNAGRNGMCIWIWGSPTINRSLL